MTVFRVEEDNSVGIGLGPFNSTKLKKYDFDTYQKLLNSCNIHNGLYRDFESEIVTDIQLGEDYRFGCKSLEQLSIWFEDYVDVLKEAGFILVRYEVENYITSISDTQVIFLEKDITEFYVLSWDSLKFVNEVY